MPNVFVAQVSSVAAYETAKERNHTPKVCRRQNGATRATTRARMTNDDPRGTGNPNPELRTRNTGTGNLGPRTWNKSYRVAHTIEDVTRCDLCSVVGLLVSQSARCGVRNGRKRRVS